MDLFALQTEITISIEKAIDNLTKLGQEASKIAVNLDKGIGGKNEAEVDTKKAQSNVENLDEKTEELGDTFDETGEKGGKLSGVLGGIGKGLATLGGAVVGAVGGFLALAETTREYREDIGKLETAFKTMGFSTETATDTYKEFFSVLGEEDRSIEAVNHLAQLTSSEEELAKWTDICSGVWGTFGDSLPIEGLTESANETAKVGKITGQLADALNWVGISEEEFNKQLEQCNSEQERSTLITNTLSEAYKEASNNYKEANADVIASRKAQSDLTDTIAKFGAIAEPIMTSFKILANELLQGILPFVELIGEGLQGALNGSAEASQLLADGLGGIIDFAINKIMELLPTILNVVMELIPSIIETLLNATPQLLDLIIQVITQVINLLGELLPQILIKISELLPQLITQLIESLPTIIQALLNVVLAIVDALPTIITNLVNALPQIIDTIINVVLDSIPLIIDASIKLFNAILEALPVIIEALVENLPKIINTLINFLIDSMPLLLESSITLLMAIIDALPTIINLLIRELPKIVKTISSTLLKRLPDLISASIQLFMGIVKAIPKILGSLVKELGNIVSTIFDALGDIDLLETGKEIIRGLIKGLGSIGGEIWNAIKGVGKSIVDGFKDFFDINSPSVLIKGEIGENVGVAVGEGIIESTGKVLKNVDSFNKSVYDELGSGQSNLSMATSNAIPSVESNNNYGVEVANKIIDRLDALEQTFKNIKIYLDSGVMVGELAPRIDTALGNIASVRERGG